MKTCPLHIFGPFRIFSEQRDLELYGEVKIAPDGKKFTVFIVCPGSDIHGSPETFRNATKRNKLIFCDDEELVLVSKLVPSIPGKLLNKLVNFVDENAFYVLKKRKNYRFPSVPHSLSVPSVH